MRATIVCLSIASAVMALPSSAGAARPGVHDDAGFFKPETVDKANDLIREIKRQDKKDLLIETFRNVPAGQEKEAVNAEGKAKDEYFAEWAVREARDQGVNGIYVLICKEPPYLKVAVGNQTRKIFTNEERDHLGKLLVDHFKKKEYDEGLLEGVRYVQSALRDKEEPDGTSGASAWPPQGGAPSDGGASTSTPMPTQAAGCLSGLGGILCVGVALVAVVGVGLMGVMALLRTFRGAPGGYGPTGYGPGGYAPGGPMGGYGSPGGGGFLSSMLGGLFGGAAGGWAYDRFFGGHQTPPRDPAPGTGFTPAAPPASMPEDTDYSAGGGGDFGGGGGDTGGDAPGGGGDFGGGDVGGGGDFGGGDSGADTGGGGSF